MDDIIALRQQENQQIDEYYAQSQAELDEINKRQKAENGTSIPDYGDCLTIGDGVPSSYKKPWRIDDIHKSQEFDMPPWARRD